MIGHNSVLVEVLATDRQTTLRREAEENRLARLLRRSPRHGVRTNEPATREVVVARLADNIDRRDMDQVA